MSQVQVTKIVGHAIVGSDEGEASVSKLVAFVILVPGESEEGDAGRRSHVFTNILRKQTGNY